MPFIQANGVRLSYRLDGAPEAPLLLLSNSLGTELGMWDSQLAEFAKRFRVLRYDSRGHGGSEVLPGPYRIDDLGRDALALLDAVGVDRARFCGLSMGGMVGMWLGSNAPERIERLVLCNTSPQIGTPELWNSRIEMVGRGGMEAVTPAVLERWFTSGFRARAPQAVEKVRRMLLATPPEGYAACCAAIRDMNQLETIRSIRAPTLVVAGTHDIATPPASAREIAGRVPGAALVELEAAHLSNIEAADQFTAAVLDFLDR
jgi:3-oxoadipate enol-lactonase